MKDGGEKPAAKSFKNSFRYKILIFRFLFFIEDMNVRQIIVRLAPFVKPYKSLIVASLVLTLIGAGAAQFNPLVLRYTVDTIQRRIGDGIAGSAYFLLFISAVLFGKEIINVAVRYGQSMLGERIRVNLSSRLSQFAVERILSYKYSFFAGDENATGKLQTRVGDYADLFFTELAASRTS